MTSLDELLNDIRRCNICADHLTHGVRPVLQASATAKILIVGQAPGIRVHKSGKPFDDPSGDRLRNWMGIDKDIFYNENIMAIVPMGFCYPGTAKSGDLPPRKECAKNWRQPLMEKLKNIELTLVIGRYAMDYHLEQQKKNLTETVKAWKDYNHSIIPLPHPSPRNNIWLKRNPWFEQELVPEIQKRVKKILTV